MRVTLIQPSLAKYRVPVYRELASRSGIELQLAYAEYHGITNVEPDGFAGTLCPMRSIRTPIATFLWHPAQLHYATKDQSDTLILSWDIHYLSLIPAMHKARKAGVRTVLWGHGYSKNESGLRERLRARVGAMADAILLYDKNTAARYVERGFDPGRVFTAPNAIDQSPIQSARKHWLDRPDELAAFKSKHSLSEGPVVLFVSRLEPANRLDLLLEAMPKLAERFPNIQTIIIGKGEEEQQRLTQLAGGLIEKGHVRFLGPIYNEQELAPWFLSASVFCYPANIGLSILHAFGYGLPVVTSDHFASQNPEIASLQHEGNGLAYAHGDANQLTEAIARTIRDTALHQKLSANAHQTATQAFSLNAMVDGMEAAARG